MFNHCLNTPLKNTSCGLITAMRLNVIYKNTFSQHESKMIRAFCLLFMFLIYSSNAAKILGIFGRCSYSHYTLGFKLMKELVVRGHNVTFISPFIQQIPVANLTEIEVPSREYCSPITGQKSVLYDVGKMSFLSQLNFVAHWGHVYSEAVLSHKSFQDIINNQEENFDLVILEHFINEATFIAPFKLKCPYIILAPGPISFFNSHLMGNPLPSAYVANLLADWDGNMTFWERLKNTYYNIIGQIYIQNIAIAEENRILKKHFPDAPDLDSIIYNASMMLLLSHFSIGGPIALLPSVKEIGGYHVGPLKPLPQDLLEFLNNSTEGVILFSMGTNLKSAWFEEDKKQAVLKAFSKIKQKILWKFEVDLPEKSENVKIVSWLPQQEVLAHPNVVAFISHGGLLSIIESVYFGVPILGLPVYWDQMKNTEDASRKDFGYKLAFKDLDEESFSHALNEILNNPKYSKNVKLRSTLMRNQSVKQLEEAMFWIEYVIAHRGATHFRSSALGLKWYQRYLVDVAIFIFGGISIVYIMLYVVIKRVIWELNKQKSSLSGEKKRN